MKNPEKLSSDENQQVETIPEENPSPSTSDKIEKIVADYMLTGSEINAAKETIESTSGNLKKVRESLGIPVNEVQEAPSIVHEQERLQNLEKKRSDLEGEKKRLSDEETQ